MSNREKVAALRQKNPCWTLEHIGMEVGISRERVRQILRRKGLRTRHKALEIHCPQCGKSVTRLTKRGLCRGCAHKQTEFEAICDFCGQKATRIISAIQANIRKGYGRHSFCSRQCQGKWLAANHGFSSGNLTEAQKDARFKSHEPRSHCKHGHEFNETNTYSWRGIRFCRVCNSERTRRYREKKRFLKRLPPASVIR